jgi:hypothetical protein
MLIATSIESWLCWVLGIPAARCIAVGALTLLVGTVVAVAVSILAIRAHHIHAHADNIHEIDQGDNGRV